MYLIFYSTIKKMQSPKIPSLLVAQKSQRHSLSLFPSAREEQWDPYGHSEALVKFS